MFMIMKSEPVHTASYQTTGRGDRENIISNISEFDDQWGLRMSHLDKKKSKNLPRNPFESQPSRGGNEIS